MIMNAEPEDIHVMFITTDSISIERGPSDNAFQHYKKESDVEIAEIVQLGDERAYMLMDENAIAKELPENIVATSLINLYAMVSDRPSGYLIRGPVMVVGTDKCGELNCDCPKLVYGRALLLWKAYELVEDEVDTLTQF